MNSNYEVTLRFKISAESLDEARKIAEKHAQETSGTAKVESVLGGPFRILCDADEPECGPQVEAGWLVHVYNDNGDGTVDVKTVHEHWDDGDGLGEGSGYNESTVCNLSREMLREVPEGTDEDDFEILYVRPKDPEEWDPDLDRGWETVVVDEHADPLSKAIMDAWEAGTPSITIDGLDLVITNRKHS